MLLTALGAALAWLALSLCFSSPSAHAAERPAGLLGDLSEVVSGATDTITDTVDKVVEPVAPVTSGAIDTVSRTVQQTVAPVVDVTGSVPVVGPGVQHAVDQSVSATTETLQSVTTPVLDTLGSAPVGQITQPVIDSLVQLPVVGDVVKELDPLLSSTAGGVDSVLASAGGAAAAVVDPVVSLDPGILNPSVPGQGPFDPGELDPGALIPDVIDPILALVNDQSPRAMLAGNSTVSLTSTVGSALLTAQVSTAASTGSAGVTGVQGGATPGSDPPTGVPSTPPGPSSSSSSAGPGGGASGISACPTDAVSLSLRAWECANGAGDDALPSSPVFDTDVSPD